MTRRIWFLYLLPFIIILICLYGLFVLSTQADDRHRLPASPTDEAIAAQIHQENIVIRIQLIDDRNPLRPAAGFPVSLTKMNPSGDLEENKETDAIGCATFTVSPSTSRFRVCVSRLLEGWELIGWEAPYEWVNSGIPVDDDDPRCYEFWYGSAVIGYPMTPIIQCRLRYVTATMTPPPTRTPPEYQEFTPQERLSMAILATHEMFDKEPCVLCQPAVVPVTIPVVFDWGDQTLYAGMFEENLGAPLTRGLLLEGEDGLVIVFRAFADGMIAMRTAGQHGIPDPSIKQWGVITWNGRLNGIDGSEDDVMDLIWEQLGE